MNYKIIAIFTSLLLVFGILAGIPFGIWLAKDELIFDSPMFHLTQYLAGFVVDYFIFYYLFMQKIIKPVQHALVIAILYWIISASIIYVWAGIKSPPVLIAIDSVLTVLAISLAMYIAKIRGKLSVGA